MCANDRIVRSFRVGIRSRLLSDATLPAMYDFVCWNTYVSISRQLNGLRTTRSLAASKCHFENTHFSCLWIEWAPCGNKKLFARLQRTKRKENSRWFNWNKKKKNENRRQMKIFCKVPRWIVEIHIGREIAFDGRKNQWNTAGSLRKETYNTAGERRWRRCLKLSRKSNYLFKSNSVCKEWKMENSYSIRLDISNKTAATNDTI